MGDGSESDLLRIILEFFAVVAVLFQGPDSHLTESGAEENPARQCVRENAERQPCQGLVEVVCAGHELETPLVRDAAFARIPRSKRPKMQVRLEVEKLADEEDRQQSKDDHRIADRRRV